LRVRNLFDKEFEFKIRIRDLLLSLSIMLSRGKKRLNRIIEKHRRKLLLGIFFLIIFIGIVGAAVYNSMYMQSNIGVEPALIFLLGHT